MSFLPAVRWMFAGLAAALLLPTFALADDAEQDEVDAPAVAEIPVRRAAVKPATADEIPRLISDLDSTDSAVRERASTRLAASGKPAVDALSAAARSGSLESRVRAVQTLRRMFLEGNGELVDAADSALDKLADDGNASVASRAEATLNLNYDVRERRALETIRELGGIISYQENMFADATGAITPARTVSHIILGKDWKTGDAGLKQIKRLSRLPMVYYINESGVTEEGLRDLQASIPGLQIHRRARACLGVAGMSDINGRGCMVSNVIPNSAAERAGFEVRDVIQTFDGRPVTDFDKLIELIGSTKPGDKIKVEVLRDFQKVTLEPVMDEWKR